MDEIKRKRKNAKAAGKPTPVKRKTDPPPDITDEQEIARFYEIMEYPVYDLRMLGRETGVRAPAAYPSKNELAQKIIAIEAGRELPYFVVRAGRPPKPRIDIYKGIRFGEAEVKPFKADCVVKTGLAGALKLSFEENGEKREAKLSGKDAAEFSLKINDRVEASVNKIVTGGVNYYIQYISKINGEPVDYFPYLKKFSEIEYKPPTEAYVLPSDTALLKEFNSKAVIRKGNRAVIKGKRGQTALKDVAEAFDRAHKNCAVMILIINAKPEELLYPKGAFGFDIFVTATDASFAERLVNAENALSRAKEAACHGLDVLLVVDNFNALARAYAMAGGDGKIDALALEKVKKYFSSSRAFEYGSLTIIGNAVRNETDAMVLDELEIDANVVADMD